MKDLPLIPVRFTSSLVCVLAFTVGCSTPPPAMDDVPTWTFDLSMVFPTDHSLSRAEDGIALADGRLIVADQVRGLRKVERDGKSAAFGDLAGAGYLHDPPRRSGATNGVSLEPDGEHLLVADVLGGGIYRVAIATGSTQRVYQHTFGVNTACSDSSGAIWFTQSTRNTPEQGEAGMFAAVNLTVADGALWRLPRSNGQSAPQAEVVLEGLSYANGLVLDELRDRLYVSETTGNRVQGFHLDVRGGRIGARSVLLNIDTPDNVEQDQHGLLWIAVPLRNEVIVFDPETGQKRTVFQLQTEAQVELSAEFLRRGQDHVPRLDLFTPALWEPLPGPVTGVILGVVDGDVYLTGLGNALVRLGAEPIER